MFPLRDSARGAGGAPKRREPAWRAAWRRGSRCGTVRCPEVGARAPPGRREGTPQVQPGEVADKERRHLHSPSVAAFAGL